MGSVEFRIFPFQDVPVGVREAFRNGQAPESSWDWFTTLAESARDAGETMHVFAMMDPDGGARAALALILRNGQFRSATSPYTTQFVPALGDPESAFLAGRALAKQVPHLRLDCLSADDAATTALVEGLRDGGHAVACYRHFANWHESIGDFDQFWNGRDGKLRSVVHRKTRRLEREHRLRFELIDLPHDAERGTELYERIYASSWKEPEKHPSFIATLLRRLGGEGVARLAIAHIDDEPAAAQIWLLRSPRATIFKLVHNPRFDGQSPGSLLTHWLLRRCVEQEGIRDVDFGRGDDGYKRLWLGRRRFRYGLVSANPRSVGGLCRFVAEVLPTRIARSSIIGYLRAGLDGLSERGSRSLDHT